MHRATTLVVVVTVALAMTVTGANANPLPKALGGGGRAATYQPDIQRLAASVRELMTGRSWRAGCPAPSVTFA
jgi:hypothetical protein